MATRSTAGVRTWYDWFVPDRARKSLSNEDVERLNERVHDTSGVDLSQIDRMLALSPRERLAVLEASADSLARLVQRAGRLPND